MKISKAFTMGQLSGMVEPVAGVLGAAAVLLMRPLLPYALAFAAGAMIYSVYFNKVGQYPVSLLRGYAPPES